MDVTRTKTSAHSPKGAWNSDPYGQEPYQQSLEEEQEKRDEQLSAFVSKLEAEAKRRVDRRVPIEQRWLADLRQYHGQYSPEVLKILDKKNGSKVFMNLTRAKTNRFISKMWDLLFPTDDRNWGIGPTPVPELAAQAEERAKLLDDARETFAAKEAELRELERLQKEPEAAAVADEMAEIKGLMELAERASSDISERITLARKQADMMADEIEDQLKESAYQAANRDMLEDAAKIGSGVLKGPVLGERYRQRWSLVTVDGEPMRVLEVDNSQRVPEAQRVDPWNFFPDPDYQKVEDGDGVMQRELMSAKHLRRLAKLPDYRKDAIREILREEPRDVAPSYLAELTRLSSEDSTHTQKQYHVWEYTGAIDHTDIKIIVEALGGEDEMQGLIDEGEVDPLAEMHVKIWFCQGKILKLALHPLDSNETIYSVFCPEKDETSPFGFGIPYLLRDSQSVLNASWRKLMDNSGFAVGPQIVADKGAVEPANGEWELSASKVWYWKSNDLSAGSNRPPFATFDIPSHITELQAMIEMARKELDEIVDIASGSQESEAGPMSRMSGVGIALLLNASNVVYRRAVKNYDDDVTVPMIRRYYHWNMQFSDKEHIKGDYEVDARGSSVLLVREMVAQNLIAIATAFGDHPRFGDWLKDKAIMDALFRAIAIPAKEIVRSEREYSAHMEDKAKQKDPKLVAIEENSKQKELDRELSRYQTQAKVAIEEMASDSRIRVAEMAFEEAMLELAEKTNMDMERVRAEMQKAREKIRSDREIERGRMASKERALATEVAMAQRTGKSAGGSV